MSAAEITLIVLLCLGAMGAFLSWLARRLDALHKRVINSLAVLDALLVRRAELAMDLAHSGALDPASETILAHAAWEAGVQGDRLVGADPAREAANLGTLAEMTTSRGVDRAVVESALSSALREALGTPEDIAALTDQPGAATVVQELREACYRVQLARRFHNDAVDAVVRLRQGWLVRNARLAGRAALPHAFQMDDHVFPPGGDE